MTEIINNIDIKAWMSGIPYEVAFWKSMYANRRTRRELRAEWRYGKEIDLPGFDAARTLGEAAAARGTSPVLVDIGCGISFAVGSESGGKDIDVHYVDPLAQFYNEILDAYNVTDAPRIEFGQIEYLSAFYRNAADIVTVQNALDHCANPIKGIEECLRALRTGGVLYLRHFADEAKRENYRGFHQYNINTDSNDHLTVSNRTHHYDVNALLEGRATIQVSTGHARNQIVAVITKLADRPLTAEEADSDRRTLCSSIAEIARIVDRPGYGTTYSARKLYYTAAQRAVRLLSMKSRERLKALLRGSR